MERCSIIPAARLVIVVVLSVVKMVCVVLPLLRLRRSAETMDEQRKNALREILYAFRSPLVVMSDPADRDKLKALAVEHNLTALDLIEFIESYRVYALSSK